MHANKDLGNFGINLKPNLRTEHIWDAFTLLSLLEHMVRIGELLQVPHSGDQSQRFLKAMDRRNKSYIQQGLPDVVDHVCNVCTRFFQDEDSKQICMSLFVCQSHKPMLMYMGTKTTRRPLLAMA